MKNIFSTIVCALGLVVFVSPPSAHAISNKELTMTRLHAGREVGKECRASQYEYVRGLKVKRWDCFSPRATCDRWPWHRSVVVCAGTWLLLARRGETWTGPYDLRCQWSMYYQKQRGKRWPQPLWKTRFIRCVRDDWS